MQLSRNKEERLTIKLVVSVPLTDRLARGSDLRTWRARRPARTRISFYRFNDFHQRSSCVLLLAWGTVTKRRSNFQRSVLPQQAPVSLFPVVV